MSTANAADGFELGYIRFVPITADESVLISAAQVNLYWHDFMVDFHGVAENAATAFCNITADGAGNFSMFDQFTWLVDETMGPMFDIAGDLRQTGWTNFLNVIDEAGAAYVTSLLDIATGCMSDLGLSCVVPGLRIRPLRSCCFPLQWMVQMPLVRGVLRTWVRVQRLLPSRVERLRITPSRLTTCRPLVARSLPQANRN